MKRAAEGRKGLHTFGLRLFKRVPLIEPLEYKEKYLLFTAWGRS